MSAVKERPASSVKIPAKLVGPARVRAETYDDGRRTVEIVWAAGAAVKRYSWDDGYYMEKLSMDPAHIRMDRFATGMSLLDSHSAYSMDDRIGVVVANSIRFEGDQAIATVQLSRNARGETLAQDLRDGMPFPVSVGYKTHGYEKTEGDDGQLPVLKAIDWEPLELSAVPIPADPGAHSRAHPENQELTNVTVIGGTQRERTAQMSETREPESGAASRPPASITLRRMDGSTYTDENPNELTRQHARIRPNAKGRRHLIERFLRPIEENETTDLIERMEGMNQVEIFNEIRELQMAEQERTGSFPHIETRGMQDATDTRRSLAANAILHANGVTTELQEGARQYRGMTAMEIVRSTLRDSGQSDRGGQNEVLQRAMHTSSDFTFIMNDVTRQTLLTGYQAYENTFQLIANRNVVNDFKEVKTLDMGAAPNLLKVNEHGEFKRGTIKESEEGFRIATYGRVIGLTRQLIINDHLGAFTRAVQAWGYKAAKLEGDVVWDVIVSNLKLKDGKPIFDAAHGNVGAPAALSLEALKAARSQFRKQKDLDGEAINIAPKYLFVGSDLEVDAQVILTGPANAQLVNVMVPEAIKSITSVYEYRLDKVSPTAWFLFADQMATMGRGLQYAYLSGQEQPFFDERVGFDVDGIEYKVRHDFGAGLTDYRFAYRNMGT